MTGCSSLKLTIGQGSIRAYETQSFNNYKQINSLLARTDDDPPAQVQARVDAITERENKIYSVLYASCFSRRLGFRPMHDQQHL